MQMKLKIIIIAILLTTSVFYISGQKQVLSAFPVMDLPVELNTAKIVGILSGVLPGQQQDIKKVGIMKTILKNVLKRLTESTVAWINSGFKGNPSFITNTEDYILDTADKTVGDFLMGSDLEFLCDPFKLQVKLALGLQYRPFKEQIECSFTEVVDNINGAMNKFTNGDFIGGGGWDSWLKMTTVSQNNQMGAMILAQGELDARIAAQKERAVLEANWGGGFMSWKDCKTSASTITGNTTGAVGTISGLDGSGRTNYTDDATGATRVGKNNLSRTNYYNENGEVIGREQKNEDCLIKTPGSYIMNIGGWVSTTNIRQLELANDINEIAYALANQLILQGIDVLKEGGLLGVKKPKQNTAYVDLMTYTDSLQSQIDAQNAASNNTGYYNSDGSINFAQSYANRASALEKINSQINIENQYFANQSNIFSLLDTTQNIFASSSCSGKTDIINKITGDYNYTGAKELVWNKSDVTRVSAITTSNISILSSAADAVQNASSDSAIPNIVQPLTVTRTFHPQATTQYPETSVNSTSVGGITYNQIKTWVQGKITANTACVGDTSSLNTWLGQ